MSEHPSARGHAARLERDFFHLKAELLERFRRLVRVRLLSPEFLGQLRRRRSLAGVLVRTRELRAFPRLLPGRTRAVWLP